jgi:hypothetical protein
MQVVKVKGEIDSEGRLHLDLPEQLPAGPVELILIFGVASESGDGKYDFNDLAGKLSWQGDAVATQRRLRDEW